MLKAVKYSYKIQNKYTTQAIKTLKFFSISATAVGIILLGRLVDYDTTCVMKFRPASVFSMMMNYCFEA